MSGRLSLSSGRSGSRSSFRRLWVRLIDPRPLIPTPVARRVGAVTSSAGSRTVESADQQVQDVSVVASRATCVGIAPKGL